MKTLHFSNFQTVRILFICFAVKLRIQIFLFSINDLLQCVFLEYVLQGIAIDERVLMMWRKHSDGVPNVLIDNTNILFEGDGNATMK